jgi:outer membrane protein insertion porin family
MIRLKIILLFTGLLLASAGFSQVRVGLGSSSATPKSSSSIIDIDYTKPKEYIIGDIKVSGIKFLDANTLISVSGLTVGDRVIIPGEKITTAVRRLMEQGIIEDAEIAVTEIKDVNKISLEIILKERPRLNKYIFEGIRKPEQEAITEKLKLNKGKVITDAMVKNTQLSIKRYFIDKGFLNAKTQIIQVPDTLRANNAAFKVIVDKGKRVKIEELVFDGAKALPVWKLRFKMKNTKQRNVARFYSPSKFIEKKYEEDKEKLIDYYNKKGYRDARITSDTVFDSNAQRIKVIMKIDEGPRYFYRNITWTGNYLHKTEDLVKVLSIKKGDPYNPVELEKRINGIPQGDVSSMYMDDGYLYFRCEPVEVAIEGDSIDLEMRVREGKQFTINKIILNGNSKTSDHVVMREIETLPGQKFNKTALIRTQRQLSSMGYFDPEKIGINPQPQNDGTVNIEYTVEEKASDQIQLSGGWGGIQGFVGTFGVTFNNFSAKNIPNLKSYRPLPAGDGQKLALNLQASGKFFQTYSVSFTEPWLGGRKPTQFGVSVYYTSSDNRGYSKKIQDLYGNNPYAGLGGGYGGYGGGYGGGGYGGYGGGNGYGYGSGLGLGGVVGEENEGYFKNTGASVSFGKRLNWPDRDFQLSGSLQYQRYNVFKSYFISNFANGTSNDFNVNASLTRSNIDQPGYPRTGSSFSLSVAASPPYSLISGKIPTDQFKWLESHRWMFDATWYTNIVQKLVLKTTAHMGFLGKYNSKMNFSPFGRFALGGAGMTMGSQNIGQELIGLRGYEDRAVYQPNNSEVENLRNQTVQYSRLGGIIYNKFAVELRYPVSLLPSATIYLLTFAEAGNSWGSYKDFNMFKLRRSAGVGARILMPAFGLIGLDFGKGFDPIDGLPGVPNRGLKNFTFSIGQQIR